MTRFVSKNVGNVIFENQEALNVCEVNKKNND